MIEENQITSELADLSSKITELRDEAVRARKDSGIEEEWQADEDYYQGIDDSNRNEQKLKPRTGDGRVTTEKKSKKSTKSTAFLNITRRFVNAAAAHVSDKLIPNDDKNYGMKPTPVVSLVKQSKDMSQAVDQNGQPMVKPVMDEQGQPIPGQSEPMTKADIAKQEMAKAKEACEMALNQINDWLVEGGFHGHSRQVIQDSARIGTGVLKGPFPEMTRRRAVVKALQGAGIVVKEELAPRSRRVDVWNLYPDPSCGEDIHRGKHIFEMDSINSRILSDLKKDQTYMPEAIDRVLAEGPKNALTKTTRRDKNYKEKDNETYDIWYFNGFLTRKDLKACGCDMGESTPEETPVGLMDAEPGTEYGEQPETEQIDAGFYQEEELAEPPALDSAEDDDNEQFPAIVVMVNDVIIKAMMSPLDSGKFPYDLMVWQKRAGHWAGEGVGRQMRTSQDGVNAAVRNLMDNAGISSGPILIIDRKKLVPADGDWRLGPRKVFYTTDDFEGQSVKDAITWIIIPSLQAELMNIIEFWMKSAEEETGLPMLLQGQQGDATKTKGGLQILNNNGSTLLRRVTNIYDDDVTKPHIGAYYEWLLMYGEDDEMKGDFSVEARGSSVLIERDSHSQLLMQMLGLSVNPAYGADPEEVYKEFLASQRFDAAKLLLSDEKKEEISKRQPPEDPRITAAKIMADSKLKVEEMETKQLADHAVANASLEMARENFEKAENELNRQNALVVAAINERMQSTKLTSEERANLAKIKATLAETSAKLNVQKDLSVAVHAMDLHKSSQVIKPAAEPAGRAENGQAFTQ